MGDVYVVLANKGLRIIGLMAVQDSSVIDIKGSLLQAIIRTQDSVSPLVVLPSGETVIVAVEVVVVRIEVYKIVERVSVTAGEGT